MEYIEIQIDEKDFVVINFPKEAVVEQCEDQILYKEKGQPFPKSLPTYRGGYLKLISKMDELTAEKIFDQIQPFNANQISGKKFINSFLTPLEVTIDEGLLEHKQLSHYKFLDNPYIFRLKLKESDF